MIRDIITVDISNKHYKKMCGYLRSLKINPESVAVSINENNSKYCPINWQNILSDGHKVKKIIFLKKDNLFLYIGFSADNKTIVYNEYFSNFILSNSILLNDESIKTDLLLGEGKGAQKKNIKSINNFLDRIRMNGIESLTYEERKLLDDLSKDIK